MELKKITPAIYSPSELKKSIKLNIGSGDWSCAGWINLDYPSEHYNEIQKNHKIIPFNIREDDIPYLSDSVDIIYCSHVVEHIENVYVQRFFNECFRVLKTGSVMRIICPDAEFLYEVSKYRTDYWEFHKEFWERRNYF